MFKDKDKRYMTSTVAEKLHPELSMILWNLIDQRVANKEELDYLQVFELRVKNEKQVILHRQEQPKYQQQWFVVPKEAKPTTSTIWCMDQGDGQIMLYPSDY